MQSTKQSLDIPKKALGAFIDKAGGDLTVKEYDVVQPDQLKPGEALIKVEYSGVCHTDLHAKNGDWPMDSKLPLVGGHEGAGYVVAIGEHSTTAIAVGDAVGIKWLASSCLTCSLCKEGRESLCPKVQLSGFTVDGTFQQYAVSFTAHLTKIPEGIALEEAASIMCAGLTVYKALKQANVRAGQWVALPGAGGGLGHLAVQYAKFMGLKVIAIDSGDEKKALCEKLGASAWIDFTQTDDIVKAIKDATPEGMGPHASIVTSASPSGYEQALDYIRPGGTVVAVGLPAGAFVKSEVFWHVLQEKKLIGSYVGSRLDADEAVRIAANGDVHCIYEVKAMKELVNTFNAMAEGKMAGRTVIKLFD